MIRKLYKVRPTNLIRYWTKGRYKKKFWKLTCNSSVVKKNRKLVNFCNGILLTKSVSLISYMLNYIYHVFYLWCEVWFVNVYLTLDGAQCNVQKCYEDAGIDLTGLSSMPQW